MVGLQHLLFLNKRAAAVAEHAEPKKKKAKREDKLERLSAFDMIASWHNGLMAHMGAGLEVFLDRGEDEARVPPSLVLSLDWDQKQWCGVWFLRNKLGLCLEAVPDVTHRRSRDLDLAIDESRLKLVVTKGHIANNMCFGPWSGGGAFRDVSETALDLAKNMDADDPLLLFFWKRIMDDQRMSADDDTRDGRQRFLEKFATLDIFCKKGVKSAQSRWVTWQQGRAFHDPYVASLCMVLCHLGLRKGWFTSVDSLLLKDGGVASCGAKDMAALGYTPPPAAGKCKEGVVVAEGAPGGSGDAMVPLVAPKAKAKFCAKDAASNTGFAKQLVNEERKRSRNTMHYVTKQLMDIEFVGMCRLIQHTTDPEVRRHCWYTSSVKSPWESQKFFAGQASGEHMKDLIKLIETSYDLPALARCGFQCEPEAATKLLSGSAEILVQDALAHVQLSLVLALLKHRGTSFSWNSCNYPGITAALLHEDPRVVEATLQTLRTHVSAIDYAEKQSPIAVAMAQRSMLKGALMQAVVRLAGKSDYREVSPELRQLLTNIWTGFLNTVINERGNQRLRDAELRDMPSKECARLKRWEILRRGDLLEQYGVEGVVANLAQPLPRPMPSLETLFVGAPIQDDAGLQLKKICEAPDWGTWTSQTIKNSHAELALMTLAEKQHDPLLFNNSWVNIDSWC